MNANYGSHAKWVKSGDSFSSENVVFQLSCNRSDFWVVWVFFFLICFFFCPTRLFHSLRARVIVGRQWEFLEKNIIITYKQNLAWLTCDQSEAQTCRSEKQDLESWRQHSWPLGYRGFNGVKSSDCFPRFVIRVICCYAWTIYV